MYLPFSTVLIVTIWFVFCCDASGVRPIIQTTDPDEDPQQVDTWVIRTNPSLQVDPAIGDVFQYHYQKRNFQDLSGYEQQMIVQLAPQIFGSYRVEVGPIWNHEHAVEKAQEFVAQNPGTKWNGGWSTTRWGKMSVLHYIPTEETVRSDLPLQATIWKQNQRNNYLISWHRSDPPCDPPTNERPKPPREDTVWAICAGDQLLWCESLNKRDGIPKPSDTFPQLIRGKLVVDYDSFCELRSLHGNCSGIKDENQRLITEKQDLTNQVAERDAENQRVNGESDTIKSENQRLIASNRRLREQNEKIVPENQRLNEEVDNLRSKEEENESLKETHYQMVIGGIGGCGFVVLLILIGLIWCMKRRNICCFYEEHIVIARVGEQEHPEVLWNYRPRSRTIDELHHKFGMNEIDKVTAKEGGDLVRIVRPLETAGAERRLSEELLDIQPMISEGNRETTSRTFADLETGRYGERVDGPSDEGIDKRERELCETLGI